MALALSHFEEVGDRMRAQMGNECRVLVLDVDKYGATVLEM